MSNYYAGIGSRLAPKEAIAEIKVAATLLAEKGFILRSGGASGSDESFEEACDLAGGSKEIFLPWKNFKGNRSNLFNVSNEAMKMAEACHPNFGVCSRAQKLLLARNCYQILGKDLATPSDFVVCWTDNGVENDLNGTYKAGGTGQALRVAIANNIPIFNLKNKDTMKRIFDFLTENKTTKECKP